MRNKFNLKVGDKVKVREWDEMKKEFGVDYKGDLRAYVCFVKGMSQFCGKVFVVEKVGGDSVRLKGCECFAFSFDTIVPFTQKIVITTDGTETLARLYESNKVVKSATAKCCPEDTFNFEIGAKLAFRRLIGEKAEKAYYTGKAVCVETDISSVTVGKVYDFAQNDGCGINDNGNYILDYPRKNLDEINKAFRIVKFIQYVE